MLLNEKQPMTHYQKPVGLTLDSLEASPHFRSDFLFFIRLAGTFTQTIFWQAFPRTAPARRRKMFAIAKQTIPENKRPFRDAILAPKTRHAKTTDMFHAGFIALLRELAKDLSINQVFSDGLRQEHGLSWNLDTFIDFVDALREKRGYLEHYEERKRRNQTFDRRKNTKAVEALGFLLLPELCHMLCMSADSVQGEAARQEAQSIRDRLEWCKQERAENIRKMFSEERRRSTLDKRRRKTLAPDADNRQVWLRLYRALGTSLTDYKLFQFKRRYDFIGQQNLRLLFKELRHPFKKSRTLVYESDGSPPLSFKHDVEPLYFLSVRIGAVIHYYVGENKKLKDIRNALAHNSLFWSIPTGNGGALSVEKVFDLVLNPLSKQERSAFCDKIESLLRRENYALLHSMEDGHPRTEKIRRWNTANNPRLKNSSDDHKIMHRRTLRKIAGKWMRALQQAGQKSGLPKAGKNAM